MDQIAPPADDSECKKYPLEPEELTLRMSVPLKSVDPAILAKRAAFKAHMSRKLLKKKANQENPEKLKLGHR